MAIALTLLAGGLLLGWLAVSRMNSVMTPAPHGENTLLPSIDPTEAQRQVSFRIPEPAWLPPGLVIKGAHVNPPNWASLFYVRADGKEGGLSIEVTQGRVASTYAYPQPSRQAVRVNGQPAVYVHGSWDTHGEWNENADAASIEWATKTIAVHISAVGLGLGEAEMIRIAESLRLRDSEPTSIF